MTSPAIGMSFVETPEGRTYYGQLAFGRANVAVLIPKNYIPSGKIIIHFHGLRIASWDKPKLHEPEGFGTIDHFEFLKGLPSDTVMLCPIGAWKKYSLATAFGSVSQVIPLVNSLTEQTKETYTHVTLSGHSAGGRPLLSLLDGGTGMLPVRRVWLFDATYSANVEPFNEWLAARPGRVLRSVARANDSVYAHSKQIHNGQGTADIRKSLEPDHWKLVKKYFPIFAGAIP